MEVQEESTSLDRSEILNLITVMKNSGNTLEGTNIEYNFLKLHYFIPYLKTHSRAILTVLKDPE